jgi:hypothetical protein
MTLVFHTFYVVRVLLHRHTPEGKMTIEKHARLRRKSMELLTELTQVLQDIMRSGDEESLHQLKEAIRALDENRRKPGRTFH